MIGFLASRFIKDYQNTSDAAVRRAYGVLCGAVGIAINLLLFALKRLRALSPSRRTPLTTCPTRARPS